MNHRDLARLLVKIAALVIIASALMSLPETVARALMTSDHKTAFELVGASFAPLSISILAGLGMFWWAGPLVDRTLVKPPADNVPGTVDLRGFEEIAITLLGLYVLTAGLAEVVYYWAKWGIYNEVVVSRSVERIPMPSTEFGGLLAGAVRIIVGVAFILGSQGLVTFKRRLLTLRVAQPRGAIQVPMRDQEN